jgi:anti-sigma factor RsiW
MDTDNLHDLTAAYALDALEPDEARAYEQHLAFCESCRDDLTSLSETASALAFAAGPGSPSTDLRDRILAAAAAERPNVVPLVSRRRRPTAAVAALAAVAAGAAVGLGIWNISLHDRLDRAREALRGVPLTGAKGSVVVAGRNAALVVSDLSAAPAGKTYEAWVLQGSRAYPAGIFAGGSRTVVIRLSHAVPAGAVIAVTVEPAGGVDLPTTKPFITSAPV